MTNYSSKTYSLSESVVQAIELARDRKGYSPNQFLLRLLESDVALGILGQTPSSKMREIIKEPPERPVATERPLPVGVQRGIREKGDGKR